MKRINKLIILILCVFLLVGCKEDSDGVKFKKEFESLNDKYTVVNIREDNPFKYKTQEEIDGLINENKSFVVFYGSSSNEDTRLLVEKVITSAYDNGLGVIYYIEREDNIPLLVGYVKGEEKYNTANNTILELIEQMAIELNTCNIEVGC